MFYSSPPEASSSVMASAGATVTTGRMAKASPPPAWVKALFFVASRKVILAAPAVSGFSKSSSQGLTLFHFSVQPQPFWSHLTVSPCLIDWGKTIHPTYATECAHVEPNSGRV